MSRADKIRSMTDEELADWLDKTTNDDREDWKPLMCVGCIYKGTHHEEEECPGCEFENGLVAWLKSERLGKINEKL